MPALPLLDAAPAPAADAGPGALMTARGALPLVEVGVEARVDGLVAGTALRQVFVNAYDEPLEALYVFPLPSRAAVTRFRLEVAGRVVEGKLREKGEARRAYQQAIRHGHRAALAEEEESGTFTMKVGNIPPGEAATVTLQMCAPLPFADGEVTYRFPLVVAPRYGPSIAPPATARPGAGPALSINVEIGESALAPHGFRSSLHTVEETLDGGTRRFTVVGGDRPDRDFVLRWRVVSDKVQSSLLVRDGTFLLTLVPPQTAEKSRPRDLIFLLDRSGSMDGWKMVAARRALARMVETLTDEDRFTIYAFDDAIETPAGFDGSALVPATDRMRFKAAEWLAGVNSNGGTEMAEPLARAAAELAKRPGKGVDRVLVLITDGQVSNEDALLAGLGGKLSGVRTFTLGIDRAVNEGFLRRLAEIGGGRCELVESEERLDAVMDAVHRAIGTPVLTNLRLSNLDIVEGSVTPARLPDLFAGAPVMIAGRCRSVDDVVVRGESGGEGMVLRVKPEVTARAPLGPIWARGHIRDMEDALALSRGGDLRGEIIATSLEHGVLCKFTSFVAVDAAEVVNEGGEGRSVVQPTLPPSGWGKADDLSANTMAESLGNDRFRAGGPSPASSSFGVDDDEDFDDDDDFNDSDDFDDDEEHLAEMAEGNTVTDFDAMPTDRTMTGGMPAGGMDRLARARPARCAITPPAAEPQEAKAKSAAPGGGFWGWVSSWLGLGAGEDRAALRKRAEALQTLLVAGKLADALASMKELVRGLLRLGETGPLAEALAKAAAALDAAASDPTREAAARQEAGSAVAAWLAAG